MTEQLMCCHLECDKAADYTIYYGGKPDDYIDACVEHVGELLADVPCNYVYAIAG